MTFQLDGGDEVYVWIGQGSTDEEKAKSLDMAMVNLIRHSKVINLINNFYFL